MFICIGKWSLLWGLSNTFHEEFQTRLGDEKEMSIAELLWFALPKWVGLL